jgi:hypothetical protein
MRVLFLGTFGLLFPGLERSRELLVYSATLDCFGEWCSANWSRLRFRDVGVASFGLLDVRSVTVGAGRFTGTDLRLSVYRKR